MGVGKFLSIFAIKRGKEGTKGWQKDIWNKELLRGTSLFVIFYCSQEFGLSCSVSIILNLILIAFLIPSDS